MLNKREYEISLWTHNDVPQVVLGSSSGEFQGQIINAKRTIKLNGTATLTFDVVMRYFDIATQGYIDNSRWYNQQDKLRSLLNDLKVKLIYNKSLLNTADQDKIEVYEFTVSKIAEKRDGKNLLMSVSCDGLEVYELAKRGTEIVLDSETVLNMTEDQLTANGYDIGTIDFWLKESFANSNWNWLIDMNHNISSWASNKIYEKPHEVGWNEEGGSIIYDTNYNSAQEKVGFPSIKNSNLYNITQTLCETFEVFCEYKYIYGFQLENNDSKYMAFKNKPFHIAKRLIRFFNKQIDIDNNYHINYGLNEKDIERTIDSKDIVTKMFVTPIESSYSDSGLISIAESKTNIMQDDFLLNFDYYIEAGMLTDAQINAIPLFKSNLGRINYGFNKAILRQLEYVDNQYTLNANLEFYQASYDGLLETYNETLKTIVLYEDSDELLPRKMYTLRAEEDNGVTTYYVSLGKLGLTYDENFKIFINKDDINPYFGGTVELDDYGYAKGIRFNSLPNGSNIIYIDAMYNLYKYYNDVLKTYNFKMSAAQLQIDSYTNQIGTVGETDNYTVGNVNNTLALIAADDSDILDPYLLLAMNPSINSLTTVLLENTIINYPKKTIEGWIEAYGQLIDYYSDKKQEYINAFNNLMGVFLREGTWTPSNVSIVPKQFSVNINDPSSNCYDEWNTDNYLGDIENWYYDESFVKHYYPYIVLKTNVGVDLSNFNISNFNIIDTYTDNGIIVHPKWEVNSNCTVARLSDDKIIIILYTTEDLTGHNFEVTYGSSITNLTNNLVLGSTTAYLIKYHRIFIEDLNIIKSSISLIKDSEEISEYILNLNEDYRLVSVDGTIIITLLYNNNLTYNETDILVNYQTNEALEQLYLEATTVMQTSSMPQTTYKVEVVDLSTVSELNLKLPKPGTLAYITDDEMHLNGVQGLITQIVEVLDEPLKNAITVSNYATKFEDLFKRIVASSETITNRQVSYERAADAITAQGGIRADFLQKAFSNNANKILFGSKSKIYYDPNDGSMMIYGTQRNQFGYVGVVRLMAGGIFMSNEAKLDENGEIIVDSEGLIQYKYTAGITPTGINANAITVGTLDVGQVNIMSGNNPCFMWNSTGLFAYDINENGFINTQKFVRFNEEGLSFVYGGNTLVDLGWNGFFLESNSGSIKISSSEDLQVFDDSDVERIKLGLLSAGYYGLRLQDENGNAVLQTSSNGNLFLQGLISIGPDLLGTTSYNARVRLGIIEGYDQFNEVTTVATDITHTKILSIMNDNVDPEETIAIYDNGLLLASNVILTGNITATSGMIGGFTINTTDIRSIDEQVILANNGIIIKQSDVVVFQADNAGNVYLKGIIEATSGSFTGTITATSGVIAGLLEVGQADERLFINGVTGEFYSNNYVESTTGFRITNAGEIFVNSIHLNSKAVIDDYLQLGEAFIYNPDYVDNDNLFIRVQRITESGSVDYFTVSTAGGLTTHDINIVSGYISDILYVGDFGTGIILNGTSGYIQSNNYQAGISGWSIKNNGYAQFQNVDIRGTLNSVVFQHNYIQAAGGTILVSQSDKITAVTIDGLNVTVEYETFSSTVFEDLVHYGQCYIGNILYDITGLSANGIIITTTDTISVNDNIIIMPINQRGIVINSTNNAILGAPQAMTFFEHIYDDGYTKKQRLVLGDLSEISAAAYPLTVSGYGLYADNVYLKGAIVSINGTITTGINTASSVVETYNFDLPGYIILWAGAVDGDIANASFRVDSNGNMVATSGFFSGAIITSSTISASEIETAVITGNGVDPALIIRDTYAGIEFHHNGVALMELNADYMQLNNLPLYIQNSSNDSILLTDLVDNSVIINTLITYETSTATLIANSGIKFITGLSAYPTRDGSGLYAADGEIVYDAGIAIKHNSLVTASFTQDAVTVQTTAIFEDNIIIRDKVRMEPVTLGGVVIGYDLHVTD